MITWKLVILPPARLGLYLPAFPPCIPVSPPPPEVPVSPAPHHDPRGSCIAAVSEDQCLYQIYMDELYGGLQRPSEDEKKK